MKRFLLRVCVFAIIMIVCDILVGFLGNYLVAHTKGGTTERLVYMADKAKDDVLIMGSSRAYRHYSPEILEDSLGMSVYNCGLSNYGIIGNRGIYKMIATRYNPKLIIYEITPLSDMQKRDNRMDLGTLRYYYGRQGVDSIFWDVDPSERYKMVSQMYRFNSNLAKMALDAFHPIKAFNKGYLPLDEEMKQDPKPVDQEAEVEFDSLKLLYLENLIKDCEGKTKLIFTISPSYRNTSDSKLKPIKSLCEKYGVPLISHYADTTFNNHKEYFSDRTHLNRTGATEYSKVVAGEIKKLVK